MVEHGILCFEQRKARESAECPFFARPQFSLQNPSGPQAVSEMYRRAKFAAESTGKKDRRGRLPTESLL